MKSYVVVGSGPAGVSCAKALLERGNEVHLLDVGKTCEPVTARVVQELGSLEPKSWSAKQVDLISRIDTSSQDFPFKLSYGSHFPFAREEIEQLDQKGVRCLQSFAAGGLSNVWGAATLPWSHEDLSDWPKQAARLTQYYPVVSEILGIKGRKDRLEKEFPFFSPFEGGPEMSAQAKWALGCLERHSDSLLSEGVSFGEARLAVGKNCRLCGLCLTGCPYQLIYNSIQTLNELKGNPRFTYHPNIKVESCRTSDSGQVEVLCRSTSDESPVVFIAHRTFVAAGVVSSLKIMLKSLGVSAAELKMAYNPYFLLPMLLRKNFRNPETVGAHTLSQIFIELKDLKGSAPNAHLQLYFYSSHIKKELMNLPSILRPLLSQALLGRLGVIQGYFHSSLTSPITVSARTSRSTDRLDISLKGKLDMKTKAAMNSVRRRMVFLSGKTGLFPLYPMMKFGKPGDGNHIGSIFPMSDRPKALESDVLGRVFGQDGKMALPNVHCVDASVLPNLPSTTLTFSAMANAYRIAEDVMKLDEANNG